MKAIHELTEHNMEMLVEFEKEARVTEADIFIHGFDPEQFRAATLENIKNPNFASAKCLMYVDDNERVLGRLDFCLLPSFAFGGDIRAYVDWIYVLKKHRHKGIAQLLFSKMEEYLKQLGAGDYFLVVAENAEAQSFYNGLEKSRIEKQDILVKELE